MPQPYGRRDSFGKPFLAIITYRFLIHDRDSIFSDHVHEAVQSLRLKTLRTPVRAPQADAYCERLIGTIRRECLDFMIPLSEKHLRMILLPRSGPAVAT